MRLGSLVLILLAAATLVAQEHHHHDGNAAELFLHGQASGTSQEAVGETPTMTMFHAGSWNVMRTTGIRQRHPCGRLPRQEADVLYELADGHGERLSDGALMLRSMLSVEPFTIGNRRYPELFQTGETAHGEASSTANPHDLGVGRGVCASGRTGMAYVYRTRRRPGTRADCVSSS